MVSVFSPQIRWAIEEQTSGHALNTPARIDRFEFLRQRLALPPLSRGTLESIP